ncbi:hypothetical protein GEMRC1_003349 [Eukaryota sp. GEM-RC1]
MTITLYYYAAKGVADKIRLFLHELCVNYEEVLVDGQDSDSIRSALPFNKLPALKDDESQAFVVGDMAILQYIARKFNTYGETYTEKATIDMWAEHANQIQHQLWNASFMEPSLSDFKVVEQRAKWLKEHSDSLLQLAVQISELPSVNICGGRVSHADMALFSYLDSLAREVPLALLTYPPLEKYHTYFNSKPSIKKLTLSGRRY